MTTAPPPARQRFNPRGRAAALPPSYTTTRDTTREGAYARCEINQTDLSSDVTEKSSTRPSA